VDVIGSFVQIFRRNRMAVSHTEINLKGKPVTVPCLEVEEKTIVVLGKWIKMASVHDENWIEGEGVKDPERVLAEINAQCLRADVFTFAQKVPDTRPKYQYPMEWDNVAAIALTTYADWWENRIPQESRKNVRRSAKRGLVVRTFTLNDEMVRGIADIYNETPVRQGKRFPKYGMDFKVIKAEAALIADRSEFIGAFAGNELVGFVKLVYLGKVASILSFLSKNKHFDKRPANALIAKAVEISCAKEMSYLLYGRYTYGRKQSSPLTEFKRRNGFEKVELPRYFIPLNFKGEIIVRLRLYRGLLGILPGGVINLVLWIRSWLLQRLKWRLRGSPKLEGQTPD
jgi:hypothetical protein